MTTPADAAREWLGRKRMTSAEGNVWVEGNPNDGGMGFTPGPGMLKEPESLAALLAAREAAAYARGVEDAAKVCDARRPSISERTNDPVALEHDMEAYMCAAAIRALVTAARRSDSARGE